VSKRQYHTRNTPSSTAAFALKPSAAAVQRVLLGLGLAVIGLPAQAEGQSAEEQASPTAHREAETAKAHRG